MKKISSGIFCASIIVFLFGAAYAQFAAPEEAITYRKSVMTLIVHHFKKMGAVVQGKSAYDKEGFSQEAEIVRMLSTLPWNAMMKSGTDKGNTTLSETVFKKPDRFKENAEAFESAVAALADLASTGDLEGIKKEFGSVASNCKSCHSQFRKN